MPVPPTPLSTAGVGAARLAVGVFVLAVIGWTYASSAARGSSNPFDFFGYFTNQTSLWSGLILVVTGTLLVVKREVPSWLAVARGVATACLIVVAVVYNVFVPGTGSAPPWVSAVLHIAVPVYAVLDWTLIGDRPRMPWRRLWIVLPYPLIWIAVVLFRGQTDGWVPYGFLLPSRGPAVLLLTSLGLLAMLLAAAVAVWALGRSRSAVLSASVTVRRPR